MNISKTIDHAADSLERVNWKQVTKELIELWDLFFKVLVILMILIYLAGKSLGTWVHQTNDWLAHHWVRILGLEHSTPTEVVQDPTPVITEEVSPLTTPAVEVELKLPPVSTEVVEIPEPQEQPPPVRRRHSRNSASNSLKEIVNKEAEPATNSRPRGPKAHRRRVRRTLAA